jgi:hypothetical protein
LSQPRADTTPRLYPGAVAVQGITEAATAGDILDDTTAGGPETVVAEAVANDALATEIRNDLLTEIRDEIQRQRIDNVATANVLSWSEAVAALAQQNVVSSATAGTSLARDSRDQAAKDQTAPPFCTKTRSRAVLLLLLVIVIIGGIVGGLIAAGTNGSSSEQESGLPAPTDSPPTDSSPTASPSTDSSPTASPPTDSSPTASPPTDSSPTASPPTVSPPVVSLDSMQRLDGQKKGDRFGNIVAISGDGQFMAVGAETGNYDAAEEGNSGPGYVTVYGLNGKKWEQRGETLKGDANGDQFGRCVALNHVGTVLAVGAWNNDDAAYDAGHAKVFEFDPTVGTWNQKGEDLRGKEIRDSFGWEVSLSASGDIVAVSARVGDPSVDKIDAGYVKVFTNNGNLRGGSSSQWMPLGSVLEGEASYDEFGKTLSLSYDGKRLAVGAAFGAGGKGRVQVFDFDGTGWTAVGQNLDGENVKDWQGEVSMSSDGSVLAVGASGTDTNGSNSGSARVYELAGSTWTQKGQDLLGEKSLDVFGANHISLSGDGDCVAVGANHFDNERGKGYLFRWENEQWNEVANVTGTEPFDRFGYSQAISDDCSWLAFGAMQYNSAEQYYTGPGYVQVYEVTEV